MVTDETFFAWLDGELSPEEAMRVEAEVAADPERRRLADQHRRMQVRLKGAFDAIAEAPIAEGLLPAVRNPEAELVDFGAAKQARDKRHWGSLPQWAAIAATLAVGIFVGTAIPQRDGAPVEVQGGRIFAAGALNHALETELASAPQAGSVRVGITFRDQSGAVCRSFTQSAASGLACREGGRWKLRGLFAAPEGQSGDYRMAAGMDPNLAALVDNTMAGEPFDAAAETAAKTMGWR